MRLIDADEYKRNNSEILDCDIEHPKYQDTIRELIDDAPTIDAVPVVRCKGCKWHDNERGFCHNPVFGDGYANYIPPITSDTGYCSYGERKDGDKNE